MTIMRVSVLLTACLCALLGLFTFTKYGVSVSSLQQASAQPNVAASTHRNPTNLTWVVAKPATAKALTGSIVAQLKAFKRDDYQQATVYQSSVLRQDFGSTDHFREMMKMEYPEFANYKSVTFGPILTTPDKKAAQVPVKLVGVDGNSVSAVYLMILENGIYRVAGVEGGSTPHPVKMPADPSFS